MTGSRCDIGWPAAQWAKVIEQSRAPQKNGSGRRDLPTSVNIAARLTLARSPPIGVSRRFVASCGGTRSARIEIQMHRKVRIRGQAVDILRIIFPLAHGLYGGLLEHAGRICAQHRHLGDVPALRYRDAEVHGTDDSVA